MRSSPPRGISPARSAAFDVLRAVESGGYASDLLLGRTGAMDHRDAGLAAEIVLGSLRFRAQLDYLIARWSGRAAERLDAAVRIALRMGIYQLRYLERVPAARRGGGGGGAGQARAQTFGRGLRQRRSAKSAPGAGRMAGPRHELSHPAWLLDRWERQYGAETAEAIARANLRRRRHTCGCRRRRLPPGAEATDVPGCYRVASGALPAGAASRISGRNPSSRCSLSQPGQTFLDLCAAPGNKTAQALEAGVRAVACDLHPNRARTC